MRFTWSEKAQFKLVWEGVSTSEVIECILKGAKLKSGKECISKYKYLSVVFRKNGDHCHIISLWAGDKEGKATR